MVRYVANIPSVLRMMNRMKGHCKSWLVANKDESEEASCQKVPITVCCLVFGISQRFPYRGDMTFHLLPGLWRLRLIFEICFYARWTPEFLTAAFDETTLTRIRKWVGCFDLEHD